MLKKKCQVCGAVVLVKKSHAVKGWGKYCSKKCQFKGQEKGKWLVCDNCGKKIYRRPVDIRRSKSKKFFCSAKCHCSWGNKNLRCGENAPNWISGETVYRRLLKRVGEKERCAICKMDDKRVLVVHHKDSNKKNNNIDNLQWLCRNCHCIVHSF